MKTGGRAIALLFLITALGLSVRVQPSVAHASCCATPTFAGTLPGGWFKTQHVYNTVGATYAAMQCTCGGPTTFDWIPGGNYTTVVQWQPGTAGYYHIWTCQNSPHDCSGSLGVQVGGCAGCASDSPDGQIWDGVADGPVQLGTQWNVQPRGSQWFARTVHMTPEKGIGGGGSGCTCSWPYSVTYVNGTPYCYTPLPPFTNSYYPCN